MLIKRRSDSGYCMFSNPSELCHGGQVRNSENPSFYTRNHW